MSATFAAPIAAVLLAFELLLFEWKPRSFIPVAMASATAATARHFLLGPGPIFAMHYAPVVGPEVLGLCALAGLGAGVVSALMTLSVYAVEDRFHRLKIHWMWWPALGGVAVGLGGLICPRALGVGYEQIEALLRGQMALKAILVLAVVKWTIWAISLGSGTSGGVLAPLLMIGCALGGLEASFLPDQGPGFWALVSMGAILGGTMRSPLTGVFFTLELTGEFNVLLPVLVATSAAFLFTVLTMKRSILTEKVARRGFHVTREYEIDPLEVLFVRDVVAAPPLREIATPEPVTSAVVYPDETLRQVVYRMATSRHTSLPVCDRETGEARGEITLQDLLKARMRHLEEEQRREGAVPLGLGLSPHLRAIFGWARRAE
jgi:H+/Cl- antiporter ClcA/CBS domain-containing protein